MTKPRDPFGIARLAMLAAAEHEVGLLDIYSRSRVAEIARARQMVYWLAHRRLGLSLPHIGRHLHRHHASVLHGVQKLDDAGPSTQRLLDAVWRRYVAIIDAMAPGSPVGGSEASIRLGAGQSSKRPLVSPVDGPRDTAREGSN